MLFRSLISDSIYAVRNTADRYDECHKEQNQPYDILPFGKDVISGRIPNFLIQALEPAPHATEKIHMVRAGAFRFTTGKILEKMTTAGGRKGSKLHHAITMPTGLTTSWDFSESGLSRKTTVTP